MAMQLTRAGEYAVKSLLFLAMKAPDTRVMASEVATTQNIPVNFVRKILESLVKTGLVKSYRGAGGGFTLGRTAESITLQQIVEAVEGPFALNQCLLPNTCPQLPECPMSHIWMEAQRAVEDVLSRYTLADVARTAKLRSQAGLAEKKASVGNDQRRTAVIYRNNSSNSANSQPLLRA